MQALAIENMEMFLLVNAFLRVVNRGLYPRGSHSVSGKIIAAADQGDGHEKGARKGMCEMKDKIFSVLQRVGRSFMLPIAILPVAGLLLGIGEPCVSRHLKRARHRLASVLHYFFLYSA